MVNLVFSYQGVRNDVIIANGSIDQTKTYVFEIKMEGVSKSLGKGLKDWDVSNGNDTMISLLNPDEKDEDLSITFYFDGGHYKLPVHLNAGGSAMFNVSDIIMMQQPDSDGNKIPPGTLHGTAVLSAASTAPQWVNVGVSVGIFNVSTATCGGHCPYCTDFIDFLVVADIGTAPVGQDTEFSSWAESSDNTWIDYTLQSQWTSSNIQVAPPSCCTVGAFTGVSPGSFTATASATLEGGIDDCPEDCSPSYFQDGATGTIYQPIPTSLSIASGTDSTSTEAPCTTSGGLAGCGVTRTFKYQVNDQTGRPIAVANMAIGDVICTTSTNQLNLQGYATTCGGTTGSCSGTAGPCGQFTDSNGQFSETLTVCAPACKPSGTCTTAGQTIANQTWTVAGYSLTSDVKSISYQCNKILVNGQ